MTQPNNEYQQVYTGHTLDRSIHITSEIGDLVPLVSFKIAMGPCSITHDLSPHAAEAFANMLIAAANATKGPARQCDDKLKRYAYPDETSAAPSDAVSGAPCDDRATSQVATAEARGTMTFRCPMRCTDYQNIRTNNHFANCGRCGTRLQPIMRSDAS